MNQQAPEEQHSPETTSDKPKGRDYAIILLVFALTGSTAAFVPKFLMPYTGLEKGLWYYVTYFIVITPIYLVLLRIYAFIFGKSAYFRKQEKKMINGIRKLFSPKT